MATQRDPASDGGAAPGPARSLRPRRPRSGANYDDPAVSPDLICVVVPFQRRKCAICANSGRGNILFLRYADELRHLQEAHRRSRLVFRCRTCLKEFDRRHAADCHRPKCPGAPQVPAEEGRQCQDCGRRFLTAIGLSQHQRHRHPAARNELRRRAAEVPRDPPPPRPTKIWSREEEEQLAVLERRFAGERYINIAIAGVLTTKTARQIRDKRADVVRRARRQRPVPDIQPVLPEPADEEDLEMLTASSDSGSEDEWADASQDLPQLSPTGVPEAVVPDPDPVDENMVNQWIRGVVQSENIRTISDSPGSGGARSALDQALSASVACGGNVPQGEIDRIYGLVVSSLPCADRGPRRQKKKGSGRRAYRRYVYAKTQDLYNKNPGLLARYVRANINCWVPGQPHPDVQKVKELYDKLWGTQPVVQLPDMGGLEQLLPLSDLLPPITDAEVRGRITRTKADTAAGPDGIVKKQVTSRAAVENLRKLFNLLMISGRQPSSWKTNRTILIPKEGKDQNLAENYRPLTISSLLSRLYWGIIDTKLRRMVRGTPRQKGFVAERGCYNNVHILNEILAYSKKQGGLVAVQLDVSKAFDTVPHEAIGPALRKKGIPEHVVRLVVSAYEDVLTTIHVGGETIPVKLRRGVKQGDPLSPFLFNMILEPLLLALEGQPGFKIHESQNISCMAFADDLLLIAGNVPQARNLLQITETYLAALGMAVSAPKCTAFQVVPTRGSYYIKDPGLVLNSGQAIPFASAESHIEYLGIKISPWTGIDLGNLRSEVNEMLERVKRLALKPHQKVHLLSTYLVPHYIYRLVLGVAPVTTLRLLDRDIRGAVKEILHLPDFITNGLFYSGKRDGGLGFPKLETTCVSSSLKSGLQFLQSPDPAVRALALATGLEDRLGRQARAVRLNWPVASVKEVDKWKADTKRRELKEWGEERSTQGKSVKSLTDDPIGNAWLYDPKLLKPSRYLTALRLRTDTAATRVAMNRATPQQDLRCRKCRVLPETLAHVLGQCTHTKAERIRRHDSIVDLVMAEIPKRVPEAVVVKEPQIKTKTGVLKPDLVVNDRGRVLVVDVTVRHEDGDYLANGRREKIEKYSPLLPGLKRTFGASDGAVLPIVIGTRGAMPKSTIGALQRLQITDRKTLLTMSLLALRASVEIYHSFMDYDAPRRAPDTERHVATGT